MISRNVFLLAGKSSNTSSAITSETPLQLQVEELLKSCSTPIGKSGNLSITLANDAINNDFSIDSPPTYETMNMDEINELLPKNTGAQETISPESNKSLENIDNDDVGETFETANDFVAEEDNEMENNDEQEAELKIPLKV